MSKKYIPSKKEKYMCEKHKVFFKKKLMDWKNEIIKSTTKGLYLNNTDLNITDLNNIIDIFKNIKER